MRRIQFLELHEQSWFPATIRNYITDALQSGSGILKAYNPIFSLLQRALEATKSRSIIDLCSGSGGPWLHFSQNLNGHLETYTILLTDKYPNMEAFRKVKTASANGINYCQVAIDARNVPSELSGFRTMFSGFHHFPPAQARAILQNAVDANEGVGIFEITSRRASALGMMFVWFFMPFALTPFIRPFRWWRLIFTYILPIIPLALLFDGLVSCLRTYRTWELRELTDGVVGAEYRWMMGERAGTFWGLPITYLIGYPCKRAKTK